MRFSAPPMTGFQRSTALLLLGMVSLALIFGLYVALSPTTVAYDVGDGQLQVTAKLGFWDMGRSTALSEVHDVRAIDISTSRRTAGTARTDFCHGRWRINEIDPAWVATTCVRSAVAVGVGSETWVLSPADAAGFSAALDGGSGHFESQPGKPMPGTTGLLAILLVPIAFSAWLITRLARPLEYRIEGGKLVIPAHFKDVALPLVGATFKKESLGFGLRTAGTGMPGLLLGRFRFKGKKVQMAARDRQSGVTVENGGRTLYVTPADSVGFMRALADAGAKERA